MAHYAGIGSRSTPKEYLDLMEDIARYLDDKNYILRSGHAPGADSAFEAGARHSEIYLPWPGFNGATTSVIPLSSEAYASINQYHPNPSALSNAARKLMARNYYQIFGTDNTPVDFVICYTPHGSGSGGTGQAIRIAKAHRIPVADLGKYPIAEARQRVFAWLEARCKE